MIFMVSLYGLYDKSLWSLWWVCFPPNLLWQLDCVALWKHYYICKSYSSESDIQQLVNEFPNTNWEAPPDQLNWLMLNESASGPVQVSASPSEGFRTSSNSSLLSESDSGPVQAQQYRWNSSLAISELLLTRDHADESKANENVADEECMHDTNNAKMLQMKNVCTVQTTLKCCSFHNSFNSQHKSFFNECSVVGY